MGMRICFLIAAQRHGQRVSMKDFDKYVRMVSYGDDDVVNISDNIIEWFNQQTITSAFAEIGMIYTDEAKTGGEVPKFRMLNEVAYLKRRFQFDEESKTYLAPLELAVCLEMPNWIRGEIDPTDATRQNAEAAIAELPWHGRDMFEKYVPIIDSKFYELTGKCLEHNTYDGFHLRRMQDYFLST